MEAKKKLEARKQLFDSYSVLEQNKVQATVAAALCLRPEPELGLKKDSWRKGSVHSTTEGCEVEEAGLVRCELCNKSFQKKFELDKHLKFSQIHEFKLKEKELAFSAAFKKADRIAALVRQSVKLFEKGKDSQAVSSPTFNSQPLPSIVHISYFL